MNRWSSKFKTMFQLEQKILKLLPEAFLFITFSYFALLFFPFRRITPFLGTLMKKSNKDNSEHQVLLKQIRRAILIISKNVPWEAACYTQALAAKMMLNKRKIESTLYLGVKKETDKAVEGHAWLQSGQFIVTGKRGHKTFSIIATYA